VKIADFIRFWQRSGFKNPDKPKIFIKKNVRNLSYYQFFPVLAPAVLSGLFIATIVRVSG